MGIGSPSLSGCFLFLIDVHECSDDSSGSVVALQMMWLQKLHLDVEVPHLRFEVVVLIELCSPALLV